MTDEKPMKSSLELAMERIKQRDEEAGVDHRPLSPEQKATIADIRSFYQAKLAEVEILHQGRQRSTSDPGERLTLEEDYRRERDRLSAERDAKIEKTRQTPS
jgi:hypothetical protein